MAWTFGDGFDCYAAAADAIAGYWDSGTVGFIFVAGRFSGSQAISGNAQSIWLTKASSSNDPVHHISCAFQQTATITGSTSGLYFELFDGTTAQCSVVFRSDGAILLQSGAPGGTTLATYANAFPIASTWYQFEIEVVVHNSTGSFKVRKNGNTTDDHSTTGLDTAGGTANNYANKLSVGRAASVASYQDDLLWRSDASSVAWLGDIKCITRYPASDASVQFSRTPIGVMALTPGGLTLTPQTTASYYTSFLSAYDGNVSTATIYCLAGYTGNLKCTVFNGTAAGPTTTLSSATTLVNPVTGHNTITFPSPFAVVKGGQYYLGFASDTAASNALQQQIGTYGAGASSRASTTTGYSAFPVANPTTVAGNSVTSSMTAAISTNYCVVSEAQQDTTTTYVYDSTAGHEDFYGISTIAAVPATTIAVTTRAYMLKSDAGSRTAAVQIKSGGTTVASSTLALTTSGWQWAWRMDLTNPATGSAWTAGAVDAVTVGPKTVS